MLHPIIRFKTFASGYTLSPDKKFIDFTAISLMANAVPIPTYERPKAAVQTYYLNSEVQQHRGEFFKRKLYRTTRAAIDHNRNR